MQDTNTYQPESVQEKDEINVLNLIAIVFRYKRLILIMTTAAACLAVIFSIISLLLPPDKSPLPNIYRPEAHILINSESGGLSSMIAASGLGGIANLAGMSVGGGGYGELVLALANSKTILDLIAEEFHIAERYKLTKSVQGKSRAMLQSHLTVTLNGKNNIVTIAYRDHDPEFARDIVNRLVELLDKRFASIGGSKNKTQKDLLESKLTEVKAAIAQLEADIQAFQTKHGVLDVSTLATEQISIAAQLRSQLILKEMEIKTYSEFARMDDPVLRRLKAERDNLLKLINEMESGFSEYKGVGPAQKDMPKLALDFSHLKQDLLIQGKIYEMLTQQYELTKLNVEGETPIFQILELAEIPDLKSGPSRGLLCIVVTFSGFFFSVVMAFLLYGFKKINNSNEWKMALRGEIQE